MILGPLLGPHWGQDGPWRAKKRPRCDTSVKNVVPEEASEKTLKKTPQIMDFGTPWDLENHALACERLKFSHV